jgi:hypothetical protein
MLRTDIHIGLLSLALDSHFHLAGAAARLMLIVWQLRDRILGGLNEVTDLSAHNFQCACERASIPGGRVCELFPEHHRDLGERDCEVLEL